MSLDWVKRFFAVLKTRFLPKTKKNVRPLIFIIVICVFCSLIYASVSIVIFSTTIGCKGTVRALGVGVYWNEACSNPVNNIGFGIVDPGYSKKMTVYIRNEGNVPFSISLDVVNWDPPDASTYITLSWDYSGHLLEPNESVKVVFTLLISPSVQNVTDFDFDMVISQA